jgi:hypothetical protein
MKDKMSRIPNQMELDIGTLGANVIQTDFRKKRSTIPTAILALMLGQRCRQALKR